MFAFGGNSHPKATMRTAMCHRKFHTKSLSVSDFHWKFLFGRIRCDFAATEFPRTLAAPDAAAAAAGGTMRHKEELSNFN